MYCLDLDNVNELFNHWPLTGTDKPALGRLKRSDFIGDPGIDMKTHVLDKVEQELGFRPGGRVTLLTHLRLWGILMNPIAVFNCYHESGGLAALALQVTNTPWDEQCLYVLPADPDHHKQQFEFDKVMHVSPFNPMDMRYVCRYVERHNKLVLHLENHKNASRVTDATLTLHGQPLTQNLLYRSVLLHPYMTAKVYYGIYRQAFGLFVKKNPLYTHPTTESRSPQRQSQGHL